MSFPKSSYPPSGPRDDQLPCCRFGSFLVLRAGTSTILPSIRIACLSQERTYQSTFECTAGSAGSWSARVMNRTRCCDRWVGQGLVARANARPTRSQVGRKPDLNRWRAVVSARGWSMAAALACRQSVNIISGSDTCITVRIHYSLVQTRLLSRQ